MSGAFDSRLQSRDEEARRAAVASLAGGDDALALLIDALGDDSWRVRKEATLRAATWPDAHRAAAALVLALAEPENVGRRNAAVEALSRMGAASLQPLIEALARKPEHRKLIVDTLGLIGDRRAVPALVPSLEDADVNVRSAAAEALGRLGGPQAEQALARFLDGKELLVVLACLEALNALGAHLPLARIAPLVSSPVLKPAALAALGWSQDAAAAALIVPHLGDRSRAVREAATVALSRLFDSLEASAARDAAAHAVGALPEDAERLLVQALLEGAASTRRAAATALGLSRHPSVVRPLVLALGDYAVEEAAAAALVRLGSTAIGPIVEMASELDPSLRAPLFRLLPGLGADARLDEMLRGTLLDEDPDVAAEAARALGEIGSAASAAPLLGALEKGVMPSAAEAALGRLASRFPDEVRRNIGHAALSHSENPEAPRYVRVVGACRLAEDIPLLIGLLSSGVAEMRSAAADALAECAPSPQMRAEHIEPALGRALQDPVPEVRAAVARALATCPSSRAVGLLSAAVADADAGVRAAAAWALGAIGTGEAVAALHAREAVEGDPLVHAVIDAALHHGPHAAARE